MSSGWDRLDFYDTMLRLLFERQHFDDERSIPSAGKVSSNEWNHPFMSFELEVPPKGLIGLDVLSSLEKEKGKIKCN